MTRHTPLKRTPLRKISRKRRKLAPARKACIEAVKVRSSGICESPMEWFGACEVFGVHAHEIVTRARGGSITDPSNVLWLCAACHRRVHDNPAEAERLGLLKRREQEKT